MTKISDHITYREATHSATAKKHGIDNTPGVCELGAMKLVAEKIFEPVRKHFGVPIRVSSFYRNPKVNKLVKGSKTSQHMKGEAIDMKAIPSTGLTNKDIFDWIDNNLEYDQLIEEYPDKNGNPSWVHVSYSAKGNRKQKFTIG